jgi:mannose/cellobiose epimerase-like protein (N-acyl-D-glucosamine 2-epimerase family)
VKRRTFLAAAGTAPLAAAALAGLSLPELRQRFHSDLFDRVLPFWDRHGIDREYGGLMHALDYDGTPVNTTKLSWFQGRALWAYSFLYNRFGRNAEHLATARAVKDFLLKHAPQPDGWWAELFSREGRVLRPFSGDLYGMYFAAEGLQEFARAAGDDQARQLAFDLIKKLWAHIETPGAMPTRAQGLWMVNLNTTRQMAARWTDPSIERILDRSIDAVVKRHYNPDIGLNNEVLNFDFTRPKEEASKCLFGHSIETLWMVMEEAQRRGDRQLWETCAARIERHLEVGWDRVYGGLSQWVNVDHGGYVWPPENPVGTDLVFRFTGEYHYMKTLWSLNEILVATLNVFEQTGAEWAARYFDLSQRLIDEKFSMKSRGQAGYGLFSNRRMEFPAHTARQDNYHPPRQLMLNLLTLDRMIARGAGRP